jgi:hypothetical protein
MLSRAYDELGDTERAAIWAEVAQEVLADLDVAVRGLARSAT